MNGSFLPTGNEIRDIVQSVRFGVKIGENIVSESQEEEEDTQEKKITENEPDKDLAEDSQNIEREYCGIVAGHSVIVDFNKAWGTTSPNSTALDHTVFAKLLVEILDRGGHLNETDLRQTSNVKQLAMTNKMICQVTRDEWEKFDNYSPSLTLKATEDAVIQDLEFKGHFEFLRPFKAAYALTKVRE